MDRSGVGEGVYEQLAASLGEEVLGLKFTAERKAELLIRLRMLMEEGGLRLPYDRELLAQLNDIRYVLSPSGKLLFSHPPGGHDDMVMALALACWAATKGPPGLAVGAWRRAEG